MQRRALAASAVITALLVCIAREAPAQEGAAALPAPPAPAPAPLAPESAPRGGEESGSPGGLLVNVGYPMTEPRVSAIGNSPTPASDFMDTRLTWTFGDDDILHASGTAFPFSANTNIGERKTYRLFFDNLNSRFGGRENLTHLVLYKKMPGFLRNLDTEASLVLRFDFAELSRNANNLNKALYDSGSFIRIFYHTDQRANGKTGVGVTLWPLDTDRFRLGYLYDISWGGTNASINQSIFPRIQGTSPGAKFQFDGDRFNVYAGFKTASLVQVEQTIAPGTSEIEEIRITQTNFGFLGGGSIDATDMFHVDLGGGYFQQGKLDYPDVEGLPVYTFGGSARFVVHHKDMPVPQSIDFQLYRNDPEKPQVIFKPESYTPGKVTWATSLEASSLVQNLKNFDVSGVTSYQAARAFALQGNIKAGYLRASLTGIMRDLPFVVRNQPGFIPFQTIPRDASTSNELFFAAAADYNFPSTRLTPGVGAGLQFPATFETRSVDIASAPIARTVVVREQGNLAILPVNRGAVPVFQARLSLKWDISQILSAIAWVQYVRDNNGTHLERDPSEGTVSLRTFVKPNFLGMGTSVQARF